MVKRRPGEEGGGRYHRMFRGPIENYDGHTITLAPALQGLDFNRTRARRPALQRGPRLSRVGAGDPRGARACGQLANNIFGAITYHTYSRAILRPYGGKPDDEMETDDKGCTRPSPNAARS